MLSEVHASSLILNRVLGKRGRTSECGTAAKTARHDDNQPPECDVSDGTRTPPRNIQEHYEEIPFAIDEEDDESIEDPSHKLFEVMEKSEPAFHPLIRALYHAVCFYFHDSTSLW